MPAKEYFKYKKQLIPGNQESVSAACAEQYDIIVIEGAGSPAEINLKSDDIVNMGMAAHGEVRQCCLPGTSTGAACLHSSMER